MAEPSRGRGPGEDPRLERDAQELHAALVELLRVYQFRDRERICRHDLSVTQGHALEVLEERGPLSLNELAAALYLDKSTTSRVIDALERKGLVTRAPRPGDRRALRLEATEAGRELCRAVQRGILDDEKRLLADFEPAVRRETTRLVSRLARAAAARIDTRGGTCSRVE